MRLKSASKYLDPRLEFLTNYTYDLGEDDLVAFGAAQSVPFPGSDIIHTDFYHADHLIPDNMTTCDTKISSTSQNYHLFVHQVLPGSSIPQKLDSR